MELADVFRKYDWNPWYYDIQKWTSQFIDDAKSEEQVRKSPDSHIVFARVFPDDIPDFVKQGMSFLPIQFMQVFCISANSTGMIHKDGRDRKCALNIPLRDCGKGIMEWFDHSFVEHEFVDKVTIVRVTKHEVENYPTKWEHEGSVRTIIERPTLVNTDVWHRIDNMDNPCHRYMVSFRFKDNPTFEDVNSHLEVPL
jgi:hypothetical protein